MKHFNCEKCGLLIKESERQWHEEQSSAGQCPSCVSALSKYKLNKFGQIVKREKGDYTGRSISAILVYFIWAGLAVGFTIEVILYFAK